MKFVNVGFGNLVSCARVVSVASTEAAPIKRIAQEAKEAGRCVDCTAGRRCLCVLVCDSGHVILSALSVGEISSRLSDAPSGPDDRINSIGDDD